MSVEQTQPERARPGGIAGWIDRNVLDLGRQMRWSYLPPLMVYLAYGISGLTGIVGTFFVKDFLGLSAQFLAALGFWAGIPWALKMPVGHLVDLMWKRKGLLVYLGAALMSASLLIVLRLLTDRAGMEAVMSAERWYVLAALLAPVGYVLQDVVADAMTVEAVPRVDAQGRPTGDAERRAGHTTMQTLGRVAIVGGGVLVSVVNIVLFDGVRGMSAADKVAKYIGLYQAALVIPVVSVLGVVLAGVLVRRSERRLKAQGRSAAEIDALVHGRSAERTPINWWILGGGAIFAVVSIAIGLSDLTWSAEILFAASMAIVIFLIGRLVRELEPTQRNTLVGTAFAIFVFRAMPGPGAGYSWWSIDVLGFDQQFLAVLSLVGSTLALAGMFIFRRYMAERSIARVLAMLTIVGTVLSLPNLGMLFGLHEWTARVTGGVVDARFIALIDTALESPLGQVAMIPMLAWIANSAPDNLKATYFAVMASFTNLALSAAALGTKYLNGLYVVTREVRDPATQAVKVAADYTQLPALFIVVMVLNFALPMAAIVIVRTTRWRSA
jgi:hypothetical protein